MTETFHPTPGEESIDYIEVQTSARFGELRRRHRSFVFPLFALSLVFYLVFVLLAGFAPEFMSIRVWGYINIGLLMGLFQFVWTFFVTGLYVWYANRKLDPVATEIRDELEATEARA
ncbi:DUF485 domain-containing protein [Microbacterium gorillae]|uniref:DUF485 domain-containing protein n=1 Tax=Microbacterium gorillae TaxID=1231063 RepID=UPI00058C76B1|nr:DUF485 domain-containing protein [Microbacterium gorillae]